MILNLAPHLHYQHHPRGLHKVLVVKGGCNQWYSVLTKNRSNERADIETIKFVMCLRRHPDMTREQFQNYWMNKHGPFFMKNAEDMRAKRYVQSHTIDTPLNEGLRNSRGMQPEYDGVAEVWFESEEDLMEAMNSPEGHKLSAALLEDEENFIDHSKSSLNGRFGPIVLKKCEIF